MQLDNIQYDVPGRGGTDVKIPPVLSVMTKPQITGRFLFCVTCGFAIFSVIFYCRYAGNTLSLGIEFKHVVLKCFVVVDSDHYGVRYILSRKVAFCPHVAPESIGSCASVAHSDKTAEDVYKRQVMVIFYFALKDFRAKKVKVDQPPKFSKDQKKTLIVVLCAFVLMVVPAILNSMVKNDVIAKIAGFCQPQAIMIVGSFVCACMKLGKEKDIIKQIPVSTIVMIVGVYTLIQVAAAAGLVDFISHALANSIPKFLVPAAIVLFAAFLSFFSSSTSTVMPLMYPLVPMLSAELGLNPIMLYTCIFWGGLSTAVSPFSTGGAITIAACPIDEVREGLPNKMIITALVIPVITMILATLGIFNIFTI